MPQVTSACSARRSCSRRLRTMWIMPEWRNMEVKRRQGWGLENFHKEGFVFPLILPSAART